MSQGNARQQDIGGSAAFVDADVLWNLPGWQSTLESWSTSVKGLGVSFGVIANGQAVNSTDLSWTTAAEAHMAAIEADPLIRPQQILVDSWNANPSVVLPEGLPGTLTHVALETALVSPLYANGTLAAAMA